MIVASGPVKPNSRYRPCASAVCSSHRNSFPRPVLDHFLQERPAKPASAVISQDVYVGEVGQGHSVGEGASESDHVALAVIAADDPPGALDLALHIVA